MIIGIDYRFALTSTRGIGLYIREVVNQLMTLDAVNTYYLYVDKETTLSVPDNFKISVLTGNLVLFEQYLLPAKAKKDQVNVLWYPSNSGPVSLHKDIKLIVTVHDLAFLKKSHDSGLFFNFKKIRFATAELYRALALRAGLKRIDQMITVSAWSAKEIKARLGRTAAVIPNQRTPVLKSYASIVILEKLGLSPKDFVYTMAGEAPHKNLEGYIKLFREQRLNKPLVVSGVYNEQLILKYSAANVIFSGYVSEADKAALYANAACFLFLSREEGFGFPVLEAMQHHLPIICANRGALPEVGGNAVLLVEPDDHQRISEIINNPGDHFPVNLPELQDAQLKKYDNWKAAASAHLKLFLGEDNG